MRVKILKAENLIDMEKEINDFLIERKDIKVIDIKEIDTSKCWSFMILYEIKE